MPPVRKKMLCTVLPGFLAIVLSLFIALAICAATQALDQNQLQIFAACSVMATIILSMILAFIISPQLNAKQAELDLKNYDFSPHEVQDEEVFVYESQSIWYLAPDPFDEPGEIIIKDDTSAATFFENCAQRITAIEEYADEFNNFCIFVNDDKPDPERKADIVIKKELVGDKFRLTIKERMSAVFSRDGIEVAGKKFTYDEVKAYFRAGFVNFGITAEVELVAGEFLFCFALSGRIVSIMKKYGIKPENAEVMEFILGDPKRAFRKIAMSLSLKQQVNYRIKKKKSIKNAHPRCIERGRVV